MRKKRLLVAATVAAAAATAGIVALVSGSASADNTVINFTGSYGPGAACAARFDFPVGANTTTIDVAATADVPANDIVLHLYFGSVLLGSSDTGTSPEAVHYTTGGVLTAGTYSAEVCPFDANQENVNSNYHGSVVLTELPVPNPLPSAPPPRPAPPVSFDTSGSLQFAPATLMSAHYLCGEPQTTLERSLPSSQNGRLDSNRVYADCPLTSRTQTSLFSRSTDGGDSFRLLFDPSCAERNRPTCQNLGGGDSEEDVNLYDGTLLLGDQEGATIQEGLATSTDHGDTFPLTRQWAITNPTTATDRQWLAWVDPRNASVGSSQLDAFYSWHMPGAGEYVVGVTTDGIPIPQPVPQIPFVGQSGQSRVDNSNGPGRGWIYQPFGTFPPAPNGIAVATAPAGAYQNPTSWQTTIVSSDTRALFPWVGVDDAGNAYLVWISNSGPTAGQLFLSASPIGDSRNNPQAGGRPGTYWTPQTRLSPPSIPVTAFPEVIGGADGHIAVAYMGSPDCASGQSDNCATSAHWHTYVDVISDASQLWKGGPTNVVVGQVSHRVAHLGSICTSGTTCSGDRSLLDMIDVSYDQNGRVAVIWSDNNDGLGNVSDTTKNSPFVEWAKQTSGPSLTGGTVNISIPSGGRSDPAGDATWPNKAGAPNLPSFDLLGASVTSSATTLDATVKLADATTAGMARDLAAYNQSVGTGPPAARLQYIVRLETATDVYHLSMEYENGNVRFFGGKLDANDGVQNGTNTVVAARYVTDTGYPVTGSLANGQIQLSIPLSALGLKAGDKVLNVTAFATAAPDEADPTASVVVNSARTVDATPPFDATLQQLADVGVTMTDAPEPVKKGKRITYTMAVTDNGPADAKGVSLKDTLPAGLTYKSASATQGSCTASKTKPTLVTCSLGDLAAAKSATVTLVVEPTQKGTVTNTATVSSTSPTDPNGANNSAGAQTTVTG
jgi:uncharacterized repeat protein (TIGR01451 family)